MAVPQTKLQELPMRSTGNEGESSIHHPGTLVNIRSYSNRIAKIQDLIPPQRWKHVDGLQNPADVGSRGILAKEIKEHPLWWTGPDWLKQNQSNWPSKFTAPPSLEALQSLGVTKDCLQLKEKEEVTLQTTTDKASTEPLHSTRESYCLGISRGHLFSSTPLAVSELSKAKTWLIKQAQAQMFPNTVKLLRKKNPLQLSDPLQSLNAFLDKDGLLRVGSRLSQSMKDYESQHPLILHGKHYLSTLIVQSEHKRLCHASPKLTLGSLQDTYDIISVRRVVPRVLPTFANERVSVDYAGPFTLKIGSVRKPTYRKAYVAIWSDNATCFRRTDKDLRELYRLLQRSDIKESVMNFCSSQGIQWKFSPPTGPHHGSLWENGVKSCKRHLKRIVGKTKLNVEEMTTTLCQIEACLNSRPLIPSLDTNDDGISPLTPGHFLIGRPLEALPSRIYKEPILGLKRWKLCQALT
ncbi:uncharacterized protein LOC110248986 [Paramuricea clavata]|uniref:Uncharacterized protein LOC110248986 n=1 Tax=Paramuricea clavata TaxID=317549 RepID=A0A6S7FY70_PARCT|nr:uncharacterized protein LOC110248986 [Paramuricea clavata]